MFDVKIARSLTTFQFTDRFRQASHVDLDLNGDGILERPWESSAFRRENRTIFVKFQ